MVITGVSSNPTDSAVKSELKKAQLHSGKAMSEESGGPEFQFILRHLLAV